jgi:hypothetical protein
VSAFGLIGRLERPISMCFSLDYLITPWTWHTCQSSSPWSRAESCCTIPAVQSSHSVSVARSLGALPVPLVCSSSHQHAVFSLFFFSQNQMLFLDLASIHQHKALWKDCSHPTRDQKVVLFGRKDDLLLLICARKKSCRIEKMNTMNILFCFISFLINPLHTNISVLYIDFYII